MAAVAPPARKRPRRRGNARPLNPDRRSRHMRSGSKSSVPLNPDRCRRRERRRTAGHPRSLVLVLHGGTAPVPLFPGQPSSSQRGGTGSPAQPSPAARACVALPRTRLAAPRATVWRLPPPHLLSRRTRTTTTGCRAPRAPEFLTRWKGRSLLQFHVCDAPILAARCPSDGWQVPRGWTVFRIPSASLVFQIPSSHAFTPWRGGSGALGQSPSFDYIPFLVGPLVVGASPPAGS